MRKVIMTVMAVSPLMVLAMAVPRMASEQTPPPPTARAVVPPLPGKPMPLRFEPHVYDFGTTNTPPSLTGTFTFQNVGSEPIRFRKPSTSCGCAIASMKPELLQAGERGELVFTISLTGFTRGPIEKQIYVMAEGFAATGMTLTAKANLIPLYESDPQQISVGDMRLGAATNMSVRLWRTDGKPLAITRLQPSLPSITARLETAPHSNSVANLHVEIKAEGTPRWMYERIGLYGENPTQEVANVPIYGRLVGDVVLSREEIYWAVANRMTPGTRSFRVKASDPNRKLEIKNLTCTLKEVAMTCQPMPGGPGYEVLLELKNLPAATTKGAISFETNIPSQPRVTVPITINMLRF